MMYGKLKSLLLKYSIPHKNDEILSRHSNWKTGGEAHCYVEPNNISQIYKLFAFLKDEEIPFVTIGYGTNILFDDRGYEGVVIKIGSNLNKITFNGNNVVAESGIWVPCFARSLASKGKSGLEHIVGIPGSLGGLIVMNGGSQRRGIGENIVNIWSMDSDGSEKMYTKSDCCFGYRSSIFQSNNNIILKAELKLTQGNISDVRKLMLEIFKSRRGKFPKGYPNCGSVFLSNPAYYHQFGPPGMIIEKLGLKGLQKGMAQISPQHANFIINLGGATSSDIQYLIKYAHQKVIDELGLNLVPEVKYLHPTLGMQNVL